MLTIDAAQAQLGELAGTTATVHIDDHLGGVWVHEPDHDAQIRFYADLELVADTVIEYYQDYLSEGDTEYFDDDEMSWSHPTIIPFATVGGSADDDDEGFFSDSFAFLFWNLADGTILSATTDDWDFEVLGTFEDLKSRIK